MISLLRYSIAFILSFTITLGELIDNYNFLAILTLLLVSIYFIIKKEKKLNLDKKTIFIVIWGIIFLFSSIHSPNLISATKYMILFIVYITVAVLIKDDNQIKEYAITFLFFMSMIHVIATIVQYFSPEIIDSINKVFLSPEKYDTNIKLLYRAFAYPGICGQTGLNAFYISIFICISFFKGKQKNICFIFMIIGFIALFMTQKRSMLMISIVCILLFYLFKTENSNKYIKNSLILIIVGVSVWYILNTYFDTSKMIEKITTNGDITSGRLELYRGMIIEIFNHPLLGVGTLGIDQYIGKWGHNIYLQIISEVGIIFGMYIIIGLVTICTKKLKENYSFINDFSLYMMIFILLYGLFGNPIYDINELLLLFFVIII